jgi:broad specificity phosphatase PhoE
VANLELTQEDYEAEFVRQRRVCEKDPDCVQKSREPWGKHLRCRCLDLEAGIMQMKVGLRWKTLDRSVKAGVETMSRGSKTTKRVMTGIVVTHQMPLAEFVYDAGNAEAVWRIWLSYDGKRE